MAVVGAATRKGVTVASSGWLSASTRALSRRPRRVLPTPIVTATPARRRLWTSARIWSCRACCFACVVGEAPAGEARIRKEAGPKRVRSKSNQATGLLRIGPLPIVLLREPGLADSTLATPHRPADIAEKTPDHRPVKGYSAGRGHEATDRPLRRGCLSERGQYVVAEGPTIPEKEQRVPAGNRPSREPGLPQTERVQ